MIDFHAFYFLLTSFNRHISSDRFTTNLFTTISNCYVFIFFIKIVTSPATLCPVITASCGFSDKVISISPAVELASRLYLES